MTKPKRRLVSRAELARLAGVTPAAITKACKHGLAPARVDDRIDLDHEAAKAYLASRRKAPAKPRPSAEPKEPVKRTGRRGAEPPPIPIDAAQAEAANAVINGVGSYMDLTLTELIERFGTVRQFKDWLEALKKIEDIRSARLDNDAAEGRLIDRELVKTHMFGAFEAQNRRLLMDMPKTATRLIYASAQNGTSIEEAEAKLRKLIESQLQAVKSKAMRVLKHA